MDEGMDTGDMILKEIISIGEYETTGELWQRLSKIGAKLLVETVKKIEEAISKNPETQNIKELVGAEKQGEDFTVAPMLKKEMAKIDWNKSAEEIKNLIRGLNPIMGAYSYLNGKKIKIWKAKVLPLDHSYESMQNGEIISANKQFGMQIKVRDGIISIEEIQGENSKKMDIKSFMNGNKVEIGKVLE